MTDSVLLFCKEVVNMKQPKLKNSNFKMFCGSHETKVLRSMEILGRKMY